MEFLFPAIVVALGAAMFWFRWRARQRRRPYGSGNAETGITSVMTGLSAAMAEKSEPAPSPDADVRPTRPNPGLGDRAE
jgi:hypothetical protein